jgi:hypothetical protein
MRLDAIQQGKGRSFMNSVNRPYTYEKNWLEWDVPTEVVRLWLDGARVYQRQSVKAKNIWCSPKREPTKKDS